MKVPDKFQQGIRVAYPPNNFLIFEEWLYRNFKPCKTDREYLPVFWTSYFVNTGYNVLPEPRQELQMFVDSLDRSRKYWTVVQYDDGCIVDFKDLDVLVFNMSHNEEIGIPLLCQPNPYKFSGGKKWFANFIGSRTHSLRNHAEKLRYNSDYYVSFDHHNIEKYCKILYESMFTLCFRGYGANSFRIAEAMQYGSIPVYISDEFVGVYEADFEKWGVCIDSGDVDRIDEILQAIPLSEIIAKQDRLEEAYQAYYTYEGNLINIIATLETEYHIRKEPGAVAAVNE